MPQSVFSYQQKVELIKQAVRLFLCGSSVAEIAKELNRSESTIQNWTETDIWKESIESQRAKLDLISAEILEKQQEALSSYKDRLRGALKRVEEISSLQLKTAEVGQRICFKVAKKIEQLYDDDGVEIMKDYWKEIKTTADYQKSISSLVESAINGLRFATQLDAVHQHFLGRNEDDQQVEDQEQTTQLYQKLKDKEEEVLKVFPETAFNNNDIEDDLDE